MLVFSRKSGDRIQIGSDIVLTIVKVNGGAVRIGIDAPSEVCIAREELHAAKQPHPDTITKDRPPSKSAAVET